MKNSNLPILIEGAGLAGSLMAVLLAKRGYSVHVYERRPDLRNNNISAGKSINLALSVRGIHGLEQAGIADAIMKYAVRMPGRMIHDLQGNTTFQPYSKDGVTSIHSISRGDLNKQLMTEAERYPNVKFFFNQRCTGVDFDSCTAHMRDENTGDTYDVQGSIIIGSDGSGSAVRYDMQRLPRHDYSQKYLPQGYKELNIPSGENGSFRIAKEALHIWPRGRFMMIALPNYDATFTCTLFLAFDGEEEHFGKLTTEAEVQSFFGKYFSDALPNMPTLLEDFFRNPTSGLMTVKTAPWYVGNKAVLLGDAAHAIVPFFGQGMNASFEDCVSLAEMHDRYHGDWSKVFPAYFEDRKANSDAIADLAVDNFYEMRDRVADPAWQRRKKLEHLLEDRFAGKYVSRYELVSFTRTPYAEAMARGIANDALLNTLLAGHEDIGKVDWDLAARLVQT